MTQQTTNLTPTGANASDERSLGQIVSDVSTDFTTLVRQEIELAKTELKQEVTKAGTGAGMLGGAGVSGYFVLLFLSVALVALLDNWLPVEVAALLTAGVWAIIAAVLAVMGRTKLKEANPQLPKTQQTIKETVR